MSLLSFIRDAEVRARFNAAVATAPLLPALPILAPPAGGNLQLVGTAFDYLLRFFVQRNYRKAVARRWVAAAGLRALESFLESRRAKLYKLAEDSYNRAVEIYANYLRRGVVTEKLLRSALHLAILDFAFRAGPHVLTEENLTSAYDTEIADLKRLWSIIPQNSFVARRRCILNPTFGDASVLIGGADADLIIDDILIDCKVIGRYRLSGDYIHQLLGYYLLILLSGKANGIKVEGINQLAIYFARHGYLHLMPVDQLIERPSLIKLARFMVETEADPLDLPGYLQEFVLPECRDWWLALPGHTEAMWEAIQRDKRDWPIDDDSAHPCNRARCRREQREAFEERQRLYFELRGLVSLSGTASDAANRIGVKQSLLQYYLRTFAKAPLAETWAARRKQGELTAAFLRLPKHIRYRCRKLGEQA